MIKLTDTVRRLAARSLLKRMSLLALGAGLALPIQAGTYTWRGTNSTAWGDAGNWLAKSIAPTNGAYVHRLEVNNASYNPMIYDASEGTTIYGTAGIRGLVVGSGALGNGTMTISGGTFITTNGSAGDVVGNSDNNTGILNISGGTFVSGSPTLALGLGGGAGRTSTLNVNSGSATMNTIAINSARGTINFNGGTTTFSNMTANLSGTTATNNFNGGIVQARTNHASFIPALSQANVRDGGAIVDSAGYNITIIQPLAHSVIDGDAPIDGGLTKIGNGTLTLGGASAYTGPTRVNAGTLVTPLPQASSALVLASGSKFTLAVTNFPWMMTSAAVTNATINFDYGSWPVNSYGSTVMDLGHLAISGSVTCNITGTGFPVATLTLMSYSSKTGGGHFVLGTLPPGAVATLTDDGANVVLHLTAPSIQNLVWSIGDGIWKTNGGLNWNYGTATYLEYPSGVNDVVLFDDTYGGGLVTLGSQVNPSATTVSVLYSTYAFAGAGSIGGTNGIALTGAGALIIGNSNNFSGPVTISGGSGTSGAYLYVTNASALGLTNGGTFVAGPANTLELGYAGGEGVTIANETVTLSGTGVGGARGALRGAAVASGANEWAGPIIIAADATRIGTEDNGNLTIRGPVTDNGLNYGLLLRPGTGGTLTVAGTGSSYGYTRTFGDATTSVIKLGAPNALSTNALQLGQGRVDLNGYDQTLGGISDNSGPGTLINNGLGTATLTIHTGTNAATSYTTVGSIMDGSSILAVVKSGKGNQTFSGATVSYSGSTMITGGQLTLASAVPMNTAITVASGGALGGKGATTKGLTLRADSSLVVDPLTAGSFTADTVDATEGPIKVSFTAAVPTNTPTLLLTAVNGFTGSAANFQALGSRGGIFYLTNGNTQLMFMPGAVTASLVWTGNNPVNPTFWDNFTTANWSNGGVPDLFYPSDSVTFNDSASTYSVAIQGTSVQPGTVTVNSSRDYSFTGVIAGSASLTKGGTGTLFLNNNNSYTGPTVITNGVVAIQTSGALGTTASGTMLSGQGTLDLNTGAALANTINLGAEVLTLSGHGFGGQGAIVNNSLTAVQINAVQQVVLAGNSSFGGNQRWDLRGTGNALDMAGFTLTKSGGNQISLVGTLVNNPGNLVINEGNLNLELGASLNGDAANTLTVNSGGTLGFYQFTSNPLWTLVLNGGSTVWGVSGSGGQNTWAGSVTLNGTATLKADAVLTFGGAISGAGSLIKTGNSTATLAAENSYKGNTTVSAGTLALDYPSLATNSTVTVASNAVLSLNFYSTNTVAGLVLGGVSQPAGVYDTTTSYPYLQGYGALRVVPSATPPVLGFGLVGGQLQLSWTGNFKLQAQTNSVNVGLGNNWADYPGGSISPVNVPVDITKGTVFFRLVSP